MSDASSLEPSGIPRRDRSLSSAPGRTTGAPAREGWSAGLTAGEHAALRSVGLDPVGQVLGCTVWSLTWTGRGACGGGLARAALGPGVGRQRSTHIQTMHPLVDALTRARRAALGRLQEHAAALGGDGVVGVQLTVRPFQDALQQALEFTAVGTAVRSRGETHLAGPFLSDLSGQDTAKLLHAGWVPTGLVMGVGAVVGHDTYRVTRGLTPWTANREVELYSDLATQARADARGRLNEDVRLHGGTAAVLGSSSVTVHEQACGNAAAAGDRDHLVDVVQLGTSLAPFTVPGHRTRSALPVLRLQPVRAPRGTRAPAVDPMTFRPRS